METNTYERPREKLRRKGVAALTNGELLQVVIGSGNAGMPVTKIARNVEKVLKAKGNNVVMAELIAVSGLGVIKAGQILASFELASRLAYQMDGDHGEVGDVLDDLYSVLRHEKSQNILYAFFNGSGQLINDYSQLLQGVGEDTKIVRTLFAEALAHSAASILVAIGHKEQLLQPGMLELSLARDVYKMSVLLSIPIKSFVLVSDTGQYILKSENYG